MTGIVKNQTLLLATRSWKVHTLWRSEGNTMIWISSGFDSICDGGKVVFNESNPNYFYSLLVENHWMCNTVSGTLSIDTIFVLDFSIPHVFHFQKYLGPSIMSANIAGGIINALCRFQNIVKLGSRPWPGPLQMFSRASQTQSTS